MKGLFAVAALIAGTTAVVAGVSWPMAVLLVVVALTALLVGLTTLRAGLRECASNKQVGLVALMGLLYAIGYFILGGGLLVAVSLAVAAAGSLTKRRRGSTSRD